MYGKMEPLSQKEKDIICTTLFYCINWFIEVSTAYHSCLPVYFQGCSLYIVKEDVYGKMGPLSQKEKDIICTTLFYCINWFIEVSTVNDRCLPVS